LNPTVSVIVRTVRRQRLRECLQSLAARTFRNFELLLVDMSGGLTSTMVEEVITRAGHFIPTARGLLPNRSISSRVFATR